MSQRYKAPQDKCHCVYMVFFLQGIGMNLPWNVFITAVSYFQARLATTAFASNFENDFSFTYTLSNLLFMLAVVMNARQSFFNMRGSVVIPQTITALIFAASTALVYLDLSENTFFYTTVTFVSFTGISAALVQSGIFGLAGRFPPIYTQAVMSGQGVAGVIVSATSLVTALSTPCTAGLAHKTTEYSAFLLSAAIPDIASNTTTNTTATPSSSSSTNNDPHQNASVELAAFEYFLASTVVVALTVVAFLYLSWSDFGKFYAFGHNDEHDEHDEHDKHDEVGKGGETHHTDDGINQELWEETARDELERRPSTTTVMDETLLNESLLTNFSQMTPNTRQRSLSALRRQSILDSPVFHTRDTSTASSTTSPGSQEDLETANPTAVAHNHDDDNDNTVDSSLPTCALISMIGRHCFSVCFTFMVTLSVFPGITSEIRSEHNLPNARCPSNGVSRFPYGAGVWQASFFLIFNVGDTVGRALASIGSGLIPHRWLWLVSISRIGFIPLLLLCNLNTGNAAAGGGSGTGNSSATTPSSSLVVDHPYHLMYAGDSDAMPTALGYFPRDVYPVVFMCLLAISNGFLASLEMMHTPNLVPKHEASRAGAIMAFFLVMGLVMGSISSFGVRAIACQCNPFAEQ